MLKRSKGRDTLARLSFLDSSRFRVIGTNSGTQWLPYMQVLRHKDEPPATCPMSLK